MPVSVQKVWLCSQMRSIFVITIITHWSISSSSICKHLFLGNCASYIFLWQGRVLATDCTHWQSLWHRSADLERLKFRCLSGKLWHLPTQLCWRYPSLPLRQQNHHSSCAEVVCTVAQEVCQNSWCQKIKNILQHHEHSPCMQVKTGCVCSVQLPPSMCSSKVWPVTCYTCVMSSLYISSTIVTVLNQQWSYHSPAPSQWLAPSVTDKNNL